jgi:hypothetical protein
LSQKLLKLFRVNGFLFGADLGDFDDGILHIGNEFIEKLCNLLELFEQRRLVQWNKISIDMARMVHDAFMAKVNIFFFAVINDWIIRMAIANK